MRGKYPDQDVILAAAESFSSPSANGQWVGLKFAMLILEHRDVLQNAKYDLCLSSLAPLICAVRM